MVIGRSLNDDVVKNNDFPLFFSDDLNKITSKKCHLKLLWVTKDCVECKYFVDI